MRAAEVNASVSALHGAGAAGLRMGALVETTKPRITRLVTITSLLGYGLGALTLRPQGLESWVPGLVAAVAGAGLASAGANTLNQWMERSRDARMARTRSRPLPSGRLEPSAAAMLGVELCVLGVGLAWALAGLAPAMLILATVLSYLLLYTPSKPGLWSSTWIGAVPGALPPVIGWACVDGSWASLGHLGPWALFTMMFVWQIPHFLAIAWMYREDYAAGGYKVLPVADPSGRWTWAMMVLWAGLLLPVTVLPPLVIEAMTGWVAVPVGVLAGVWFLGKAVAACRRRTRADARRVLIASVVYLPVLMAAWVADAALGLVLR
ncbi:MAG: protoheme IX farnesyltransferase [Phycisphaerales bacterium]|nr:MAG: protoheme IX farnesyltransferase [Phycisphaerales bacterium]